MMFRYFLSEAAREQGVTFSAPRPGDAGFDLRAIVKLEVAPHERVLVSTGLHLAIPEGFVGLVRDRSSVALRGLTTLAGVIDSTYRGEVKVLLYNTSHEPQPIVPGDRIAQLLLVPVETSAEVVAADSLDALGDTTRGHGGFGSTGR